MIAKAILWLSFYMHLLISWKIKKKQPPFYLINVIIFPSLIYCFPNFICGDLCENSPNKTHILSMIVSIINVGIQ